MSRYDAAVPYVLEFCTLLATRDSKITELAAKQVFDTVQGILRDSSQWHIITVSRAVVYALRILRESYVSSQYGWKARNLAYTSRIMILPTCHSFSTRYPAFPRTFWPKHQA